MRSVRGHFRPEFVNRIDDIVVFHQLSIEHLRAIVEIQFAKLHDRVDERNIDLTLSTEAADWLATKGHDPSFGARPLKRLLQKEVADRLALQLLEGDVVDGDSVKVVVDKTNLALARA